MVTRSSLFIAGLAALAASILLWPGHAAAATGVNDIIQLDTPRSKPQIDLTLPLEKVQSPIIHGGLSAERQLPMADIRNLEALWKSVITRNPVIQFSLKQLATPPELRYAHASIMTKTVSGLLSGMAMMPMAMGAGGYATGTSMMGGEIVDRAVRNSKKLDPNQLPSDTELVQLSSTLQSLQSNLVENYFDYKNSLQSVLQHHAHIEALAASEAKDNSQSSVMMLWRQSARIDALAAERQSRQSAMRYYLALERMVGPEGMNRLRFDGTLPPPAQDIPPSPPTPKGKKTASATRPLLKPALAIPMDFSDSTLPSLETSPQADNPVTMGAGSTPMGDIVK